MAQRALITGVTGQDGMYLSELLLAKGYEVFGLIRDSTDPRAAQLAVELPAVAQVTGNLMNLPSLEHALAVAAPDEVYNLGAVSHVAYSWRNVHETVDATAKGTLNLLEALRSHAGPDVDRVRFYQASSSEMFGRAHEVPQTEMSPVWPRSPYGVSKVFAHYMTINYRESYGMHASCGILFNHESPRRGVDFVTRKISLAVARISLGLQDSLTLGNLNVRRDWGFAGDYVEAMWRMMQQEHAGDYVVATGEAHSLTQYLDTAFACVGIEDWAPYVVHDQNLRRPAEIDVVVGDASKARDRLGWTRRVGFEDLVELMVRADLERQSRSPSRTGADGG